MISIPRYLFIFSLSLLAFLLTSQSLHGQSPQVRASLASDYLVVGEQTELTVEVFGIRLTNWPTPPKVSPLTLKQKRYYTPAIRGRTAIVFVYTVSCYKSGRFTIPPFEFQAGNRKLSTESFDLRVFPKEELQEGIIQIGETRYPYLSAMLLEKKSPFVGETQSAVAKLYLPGQFNLRNFRLIDLETGKIAAWRFSPDKELGSYLHQGQNYTVLTYPSSITALSEGDLQLGPGSTQVNLQWQEARRGMASWGKNQDARFHFPKKSFKARPLPTPKPPGFEGAVGNFNITARASTTKAQQHENITVELKISGTGNFDQFPGPTLRDDNNDWKQFEMHQKPQGSERRSSSGQVEFSHVIRPNVVVAGLPPYELTFFDPLLEKYRTVKSAFQPLTITVAPQAAVIATDTGESSYLSPGNLPLLSFGDSTFPFWIWQIVPAGIIIFFLTAWTREELKRRKAISLPVKEFEAALDQVAATSTQRVSFYRAAANFITNWKGQPGVEEFATILNTRDEICFSPDTPDEPVPSEEKKWVLESLKKLCPLVTFFVLLCFSEPAAALSQDPKVAKAEILKEMESKPCREHFHNLALAEKSMGNESAAVLWAYRYAAQGGDASDLFKGLPGIRPREPKGSEWVSILPMNFYQQVFAAGLWGTILIFFFFRMNRTKLRKILLISFSSFAPLLLLLGALCWLMYPKDVSFAPLWKMSVLMEESSLQAQPFDGGHRGRTIDAGSLGLVTSTSRGWVHLEFPGDVKGWFPEKVVQPITE